MAEPVRVSQQLGRVSRQYFQLLGPEQLEWPSGDVLKDPEVQAWIYHNIFSESASHNAPPDRYRLRVLKNLLSIIESAVKDPDEDVGYTSITFACRLRFPQ
jgi:protein-lysine N-methyltransferase EEF2KMT